MEEKRKYYVAVESGQILEDQGAASYELEIEATDQEFEQLKKILSKKNVENIGLFIDPHIPTEWDEVESDVQSYNDYLIQAYEQLYKLGTAETRKHIEENQIIQKIRGDFQGYDFS